MDIYGCLSIYLQSQGLPVRAVPVTFLVVFVINHDTQTPT